MGSPIRKQLRRSTQVLEEKKADLAQVRNDIRATKESILRYQIQIKSCKEYLGICYEKESNLGFEISEETKKHHKLQTDRLMEIKDQAKVNKRTRIERVAKDIKKQIEELQKELGIE